MIDGELVDKAKYELNWTVEKLAYEAINKIKLIVLVHLQIMLRLINHQGLRMYLHTVQIKRLVKY